MVAVLRPHSCAHLQVALVEDQGHRLWVLVPVHCPTSGCDGGLMDYAFTFEAIELELISFACTIDDLHALYINPFVFFN